MGNNKIVNLEEAVAIRFELKNRGKTVVFITGCFDILHVGHIHFLKEAKKLGNIIMVGLNSDNSVRELKGNHRPIIPECDRAEILAALSFVDYVVIFDEPTAVEILKKLKPNIYVDDDLRAHKTPEAETVIKYGGRLEAVPYIEIV